MSADVLRRAAAQIKGDDLANDFEWAVADWLLATAERIDAAREVKDGGRRNHGWRGSREALAVARAYLGESA